MVTRVDSSDGAPSSTVLTDAGKDGPGDALHTDSVPKDVHEAAIAEERKRRSGQERTHQREINALRSELTEVKELLKEVVDSRDTTPDDVSLDDISDPTVRRHLANIYTNTRAWQDTLTKEAEQSRRAAAVNSAIQEAVDAGVPEEELDTSSVASVKSSGREYLYEKRIRDLEARLETVSKEKETAATVARVEAGATTVSTVVGRGANPMESLLQEVQSRREAVIALQTEARSNPGPQSMVIVRQARQALDLLAQQEQAIKEGRLRELPALPR